jgi:nitrogen fixation protein NifU and related proteins
MFSQAEEIVFDRYKNPRYAGSLAGANWSGRGINPLCGDEVVLFLKLERGGVLARHQCRACAVCTAASDMLCEQLEATKLNDWQNLDKDWMVGELGIPLSPLRIKCALLPLETLKQAEVEIG